MVDTVHARVTIDNEVCPVLTNHLVGGLRVLVVVYRRHVEGCGAGGGEVAVGHHHQAEGVVRHLTDICTTFHLVGMAAGDVYPCAVCVGALMAGVIPVADVVEGGGHVYIAAGVESGVQRGVPGGVYEVYLAVAAGHHKAFADEFIVVTCRGGGHLEDGFCHAELVCGGVGCGAGGNLHRPVLIHF